MKKNLTATLAAMGLAALLGTPVKGEDAPAPVKPRKPAPVMRLDKNGDGVLDAEEIQAAKNAGAKNIDKMDANGDGIIDQEEVKQAREKRQNGQELGQAHREKARQRLIQKFDKDGDGQLNEEEQAAADAAHQEMIKQYDTDGDGKLSREERQEMIKQRRQENPGKGKGKGKGKNAPTDPVIVE